MERNTTQSRPAGWPCGPEMQDRMKAWAAGGSDPREMMRACPCGSFARRHRVFLYTALTGFALALIAIPAGLVLGVLAFFRTLG